METLMYLDKAGVEIAPMLNLEGRVVRLPQDQPAPKGASWRFGNQRVALTFDTWIDMYPTPGLDGLVVIFPRDDVATFKAPDNAAIYNADGKLRFRLKAPRPLARHLPGYIHTPEEVAALQPDGFWQVGWGYGDGITDSRPHWMWAHIGLWRDVYERRYFDPATGKFDLEHYSTARI